MYSNALAYRGKSFNALASVFRCNHWRTNGGWGWSRGFQEKLVREEMQTV